MIDPLAGMLWLTGASAILIAVYFLSAKAKQQKSLVLTLAALGGFSAIQGFWMIDTWPLVGSYNILFGEIYTAYSLILLAGALSLLFGGELKGVSYLAAMVGVWGIVDGYGILVHQMTQEPVIAAALYITGALSGFLSVPATHKPTKLSVTVFALFLVLFALIAIFLGATASYEHLSAFSKYTP